MAIDYAKFAKTALAQIEKAGKPIMLHVPGTGGGYVPGVGLTPEVPGQDVPGVGALFGYKQEYIDGSTVRHGDQRLLVAPQIAVEPMTGYTVTVGGVTYNVVNVDRVSPAGIPVLYKLQLRGV